MVYMMLQLDKISGITERLGVGPRRPNQLTLGLGSTSTQMNDEDLSFFLKHSELREEECRRLILYFDESKYAVILLNDRGLELVEFMSKLAGEAFIKDSHSDFLTCPFNFLDLEESSPRKQTAWQLLYDGNQLIIPSKKSQEKLNYELMGNIIIGKENIAGNKIQEVKLLSKSELTPFVLDQWGDSYNDSYFLEPRIVDTIPMTVFQAVSGIMEAAKVAYKSSDFETAASKYQKAFHYCHSYYPDDLDPEDLDTATKLKMQSLLNLALASLKCNTRERLSQAIESCDFVLEMPEADHKDKAKALYRKGLAFLYLGDDEAALKELQRSQTFLPDPATKNAIESCNRAKIQRQIKLKNNMTQAFR